jgi:hypothetical protein
MFAGSQLWPHLLVTIAAAAAIAIALQSREIGAMEFPVRYLVSRPNLRRRIYVGYDEGPVVELESLLIICPHHHISLSKSFSYMIVALLYWL